MSAIIKYLGVLLLLIGVIILAVPTLMGSPSNAILLTGLLVIIIGYITHIVANRKVQ